MYLVLRQHACLDPKIWIWVNFSWGENNTNLSTPSLHHISLGSFIQLLICTACCVLIMISKFHVLFVIFRRVWLCCVTSPCDIPKCVSFYLGKRTKNENSDRHESCACSCCSTSHYSCSPTWPLFPVEIWHFWFLSLIAWFAPASDLIPRWKATVSASIAGTSLWTPSQHSNFGSVHLAFSIVFQHVKWHGLDWVWWRVHSTTWGSNPIW